MSRYIVTDQDSITRTDTYLIRVACADKTVFDDLEPRRLFPISDPERYVTLLDKNGKEVALIRDLGGIGQSSREAVEACFSDYYMIPVIRQILSVEDRFGLLKWQVVTDRGEITFSIRNRHSDIKVLEGDRLLVRDANDNRYISYLQRLDKASLRAIYSYL